MNSMHTRNLATAVILVLTWPSWGQPVAPGTDSTSGGTRGLDLGAYAVIGGGLENHALGARSTVSGGRRNAASGRGATVGGGFTNSAAGDYAVIGGGWQNRADAYVSTVGGGWQNTAAGMVGTIGGGQYNQAGGAASAVGGGWMNLALGSAATVPGGRENTASGDFSLAAGRKARAAHEGSFVWSDAAGVPFTSTGTNQFLIRAGGNVGIDVNQPIEKLTVAGNIAPAQAGTADLGAETLPWRHLYLRDGIRYAETLAAGTGGTTNLLLDASGNLTLGGRLQARGFEGEGSGLENVRAQSVAAGAVTDAAVAEGAGIDPGKIRHGALTAATRFDGDVSGSATNLHLRDGAVTTNKLDLAALDVRYARVGTPAGEPSDSSPERDAPVNNASSLWRVTHAGESVNVVVGDPLNRVGVGTTGATISGGGRALDPNEVSGNYATVSGGLGNRAAGPYATTAGGSGNLARESGSTVGGGISNVATNDNATVAGGRDNVAGGLGAAVGGGRGNVATNRYAAVGGGYSNTAAGSGAAVGGGFANTAKGFIATVPGGSQNVAGGDYSHAAGRRAKALHYGSMVWADGRDADFVTTASNQVLFRAEAGVGIDTEHTPEKLTVAGNIAPATAGAYTLGTTKLPWQDLVLSERVLFTEALRIAGPLGETAAFHEDGDVEVQGAVRAARFIGDGSLLTNLPSRVGVAAPAPGLLRNEAVADDAAIDPEKIRGTALTRDTAGEIYLAREGGAMTGPLTLPPGGLRVGDQDLLVRDGKVAIGTTNTSAALTVAGIIHATEGGIRFPDGTVQKSAATVSGPGSEAAPGPQALGETAHRLVPHARSPNLIGGSDRNTVQPSLAGATIAGGGERVAPNVVSSDFGTIGGGAGNGVGGIYGTVGGGWDNQGLGARTTIGGGRLNTATGVASSVLGGYANFAGGSYAVVGGGWENNANGYVSTISGGWSNVATGNVAVVGGGLYNVADGAAATVSGGWENVAKGVGATVPGGKYNAATEDHAAAMGYRAKAQHPGAFVWADSTDEDFLSTGEDQFLIRARGHVGIGTAEPAEMLTVDGNVAPAQAGTADLGTESLPWRNVYLNEGIRYAEAFTAGAGGATNLLLDASGNLTLDGRLQAQAFEGEGSGLRNVQAQSVAAGAVTDTAVAEDAGIDPGKIRHGALTTATRFDGDVSGSATNLQLRQGAVRSLHLGDGSVTTNKLDLAALDARYAKVGGNTGEPTHPSPGEEISVGVPAPLLRLTQAGESVNVLAGALENRVGTDTTGATISGGGRGTSPNEVSGNYSTVSGGSGNRAAGPYASISGGFGNLTQESGSAVGGGISNVATNPNATVSGGRDNVAGGLGAVVGGGRGNAATNRYTAVGGGYQNSAAGSGGVVAGGFANAAHGFIATVPGGSQNEAGGDYSHAAGRRAKAMHFGSMVWADGRDADFVTTASNQVLFRAESGVGIDTEHTPEKLTVAGNIAPSAPATHDLGTPALPWKDLVLSEGVLFTESLRIAGPSGETASFHEDGDVDVRGAVRAARFIGDGSLLTNLPVVAEAPAEQGPLPPERIRGTALTGASFFGGVVTGTYGNLELAADVVGSEGIRDSSVSLVDLDLQALDGRYLRRTEAESGPSTTPLEELRGLTSALAVTDDGWVGIGSDTPGAPLDVAGEVRALQFTGSGSGLTGVTAAALSPGVLRDEAVAVDAAIDPAKIRGTALTRDTADEVYVAREGGTMTGPLALPPGGLRVGDGELLVREGTVSIGSTNASTARLEVNGRISLSGGNPGQDKVLVSDAEGLARWERLDAVMPVRSTANAQYAALLGPRSEETLSLQAHGRPAFRIEPHPISPNLIGGNERNTVQPSWAGGTISGGGDTDAPNTVSSNFGTIGGGAGNHIRGTYGTVSGGWGNEAYGDRATIGGGRLNTATGVAASVTGGFTNSAAGNYAAIGGGWGNTAAGYVSTVSGGWSNLATGTVAVVGGGQYNVAVGAAATIGGGWQNVANGLGATVPGGKSNTAGKDHTAAMGYRAKALHQGTFVWADSADADFASTGEDQFLIQARGHVGIGTAEPGEMLTVDGNVAPAREGVHNLGSVSARWRQLYLGHGIDFSDPLTFSSDGKPVASLDEAGTLKARRFVGDGSGLTGVQATVPALAPGSVTGAHIAPGSVRAEHLADDVIPVSPAPADMPGFRLRPGQQAPSLIAGADANAAADGADGVVIAGGGATDGPNLATHGYATIGGGMGNRAANEFTVVAGGSGNAAGGFVSTVSGGQDNAAFGSGSTVSGGFTNRAAGSFSAVAGGAMNRALGNVAFVGGGYGSTASGAHAAVVGGSLNEASGDHSLAAGRRARARHPGSFVWGDSSDADVASRRPNEFVVRASGGAVFYTDAGMDSGTMIESGSGSWANLSDRAAKREFAAVDPDLVLDALADVDIGTWRYRTEPSGVRHMGPAAQDFHAAFGLGSTDTHITAVDADGVALAAIKGLYQKLQAQESRLDTLRRENERLASRLRSLETAAGTRGAHRP